ncbi:MAG: DUF4384 domain-containing protein [Nitrospirota bacterium]
MTRLFYSLLIALLLSSTLHAAQSTITEAEGYSCMGEDKSRKQTKDEAFSDAERKALERVVVHVKSETRINNLELEKDIVEAYSLAKVKILDSRELGWYKDEHSGDCVRVSIKAEVVPDEKAMERLGNDEKFTDDPSLPLSVKVWTDRKEYSDGQKVRIYISGNKPFYARVLYKNAEGGIVQLLPNPFRLDNYFNGGMVYEIPSGNDRFDLEVAPPFGEENVTVYASTTQLGDIDLEGADGVYQVRTRGADIGTRTRGVVIRKKTDEGGSPASEFFESSTVVRTGK